MYKIVAQAFMSNDDQDIGFMITLDITVCIIVSNDSYP